MFTLEALSKFLKESGMRKVGSLLYIFTGAGLLAARVVITGDQFVTLAVAVIAGIVGGNAFEHHAKSKGAPVADATKPA